MRLKVLRNVGKKDTMPRSADPTSLELPFKKGKDGNPVMYVEGEVAEFSKEDADKLIKSGMGEETDAEVGLPPPAPSFGVQPMPVTIVEAPKHRTEPPENPPGNKLHRDTGGK